MLRAIAVALGLATLLLSITLASVAIGQSQITKVLSTQTNNGLDNIAATFKFEVGPPQPWAMSVNETSGMAYVSGGRGVVSIISGTTLVKNVFVGDGNLNGIAVDSFRDRVYLTKESSNSVALVEAGELITSDIPVGNRPLNVAVHSPTGLAYVVNFGDATVHVISRTENVAVINTTGPLDPYNIAVENTSGYVYVPLSGDYSKIAVIRDTKLITTLVVPRGPGQIIANQVSGLVYRANRVSNNVSVISGTEVIATVPVQGAPHILDIDPISQKVYVVNEDSRSISIIQGTEVIDTIEIQGTITGLKVQHDTGHVYLSGSIDGKQGLFRLKQDSVMVVDETLPYYYLMASGVNNGLLYFTSDEEAYNLYSSALYYYQEGEGTGRFTYAAEPTVIEIDESTGIAYILGAGNGTVRALSGPQLKSVSLGEFSRPIDIAIDSARGRQFVALSNPPSIVVMSNTSVISTFEIDGSYNDMALDKNTGVLYLSTGYNRIFRLSKNLEAEELDDGVGFELLVHPVSNLLYGIRGDCLHIHNSDGSLKGKLCDAFDGPMAANSHSGYVYIADVSGGRIAVIDGFSIVSWIDVGQGHPFITRFAGYTPFTIAPDPNSTKVYVANYHTGTISVIDGAKKVAEILLDPWINSVAIDPRNGDVLATSARTNTLYLLRDNMVIWSGEVGQRPSDVAVDSKDGRVFVTHLDDSTLWVLGPGIPPLAAFEIADPTWVGQSTIVTNNSVSLYEPMYSWDWGDGTQEQGYGPGHLYESSGRYTVILTATNEGGESSSTNTVTVFGTPEVDFTAEITSGVRPLHVQFINTSTTNPLGDQSVQYKWDFGDGNWSSEVNPIHTYSSAGIYDVKLSAFNPAGTSHIERTSMIEVYPIPASGTLTISPPYGKAPLEVEIMPELHGDYEACSWDFGDGEQGNECKKQRHVFIEPGVYKVQLVVKGQEPNSNLELTATVTATVPLPTPVTVPTDTTNLFLPIIVEP